MSELELAQRGDSQYLYFSKEARYGNYYVNSDRRRGAGIAESNELGGLSTKAAE